MCFSLMSIRVANSFWDICLSSKTSFIVIPGGIAIKVLLSYIFICISPILMIINNFLNLYYVKRSINMYKNKSIRMY